MPVKIPHRKPGRLQRMGGDKFKAQRRTGPRAGRTDGELKKKNKSWPPGEGKGREEGGDTGRGKSRAHFHRGALTLAPSPRRKNQRDSLTVKKGRYEEARPI